MTKPQAKERESTPDLLQDVAPKAAPAKPLATVKPKTQVTNLPAKAEARPNLLAAIVAAASDPQCQPEKMHALLDVRNRLMREMAEVGYRRAYRDAKRHMPRISKDGKIDEGTTRSGRQGKKALYPTYENINKVISKILDDAGLDLSLHAEPKPVGEGVLVRATLSYVATTEYGEIVYAESSLVPMPPDPTGSKNAAQAMSSALAFAKRNAVILVLNLISDAPEDRDLDGATVEKKDLRPAAGAAAADRNAKVRTEDPPEPGAKITGIQAKELLKAIDECGVEATVFMSKYEITAVHDMPAGKFDEAIQNCRDFGKRTAEAKRRRAAGGDRG